jgi:hypothetical protein
MKWTVEPGDFEIKIGSSSEGYKIKRNDYHFKLK